MGRRRHDRSQDLAPERPQRDHHARVDEQVHGTLLPPALARERLQPDEAAVGKQARPQARVAELRLEASVGEVAVVEDQRMAEAREVDDREAREDERQPGEIASEESAEHGGIVT